MGLLGDLVSEVGLGDLRENGDLSTYLTAILSQVGTLRLEIQVGAGHRDAPADSLGPKVTTPFIDVTAGVSAVSSNWRRIYESNCPFAGRWQSHSGHFFAPKVSPTFCRWSRDV